jgi:hypothetical protein
MIRIYLNNEIIYHCEKRSETVILINRLREMIKWDVRIMTDFTILRPLSLAMTK